jgi:hypothetical protein
MSKYAKISEKFEAQIESDSWADSTDSRKLRMGNKFVGAVIQNSGYDSDYRPQSGRFDEGTLLIDFLPKGVEVRVDKKYSHLREEILEAVKSVIVIDPKYWDVFGKWEEMVNLKKSIQREWEQMVSQRG